MGDEVEKLITNLDSLNSVSNKAGIEFQGLTKRLIVMSDTISGAGRKWTIFSRIVSGSPIWKLQNKIRAFVDSLAMIQEASEKNAKAQKEMDDKVITLVKNYRFLTKVIDEGNNKGKTELGILKEKGEQLTAISNKLRKEKSPKYIEQAAKDIASLTDKQKGAIENTVAFNRAFMLGKSDAQAYAEGIDELTKKAKQMQGAFQEGRKGSRFAEGLKTTKGRKKIEGQLDKKAEAMKDSSPLLTILNKDGRKTLKDGLIASYKAGEFKKAFGSALEKTKQGIDKMAASSGNVLSALKDGDIKGLYSMIQGSITKSDRLSKLRIKYRNFMMGVANTARPVLNYAFKVMIMLMLGIIVFMVLAKFIYDSLGILEEMGVINDIMAIGSLVLDNVMLIFSMIGALLSGDIYTFMDYALEMVDNLLLIGLGIIKVVLKGLLALAIGVFYTGLDIIHRFFTDDQFRSAVFKIAKKALFIFLAAYVIKQIVIQMLTVAAIYAMPLLLGAVILAGVGAIIMKVFGKLPFFADGGVSTGGMAVVGERGPELVSLPKGSRVHSNAESKKMASSSNVVNNNVSVTINAKDTSDAELRRIADQVGNMITNKLNRTTSSSGFIR